MQQSTELHRDLVLVGGGHSHALALRMLAMQPLAGLRVTLISPAAHTPYSGMLPGLIAGHYAFEETHIDLSRLCQWAGARFITGEVCAIDPGSRSLSLVDRPAVSYDLLSLDIGSQPDIESVPGAAEYGTPVKPVAGLWQRWCALEQRLAAATAQGPHRIAVVGGGAGSVELALAMAHRLGDRAQLALWCGAPEILQGYNRFARRSVVETLKRAGIALQVDARVTRVEQGLLHTNDGRSGAFDELFWCTAAAAAPWVKASGLATDERGFLAVNAQLQSTADERVFAAGDIATMIADPRPKAGVYAVRQAPVLAHNLRAALLGKPLESYKPQRRFLSLLSLGDKRATADRAVFSASGTWVWHWKDRIDRAFMRRFSELPRAMNEVRPEPLPELRGEEDSMACGGCGAKVGADTLGLVLTELARQFPGHCAPGSEDAVSVPAAGAAQLVQSLDILREMVSDQWIMGRIAANHALSDLYARAARPVSALAAVTLPFASERILQRDLQQLLAGAVHEFSRVDCVLNGGHSLQGSELQIGFAVNGVPADADGKLLSKQGVRAGDQLILTKPLGTGALFAAHMRGLADGRDIHAALLSMLTSNARAGELALRHEASACTDVTGFGLLGHLLEMLGAGHGATLYAAALPLLGGTEDALKAGAAGSMAPANRAAHAASFSVQSGVDDALADIVFDAQTSGGLLISLPASRAAALLEDLLASGYHASAIVGEVGDAGASEVTLARSP